MVNIVINFNQVQKRPDLRSTIINHIAHVCDKFMNWKVDESANKIIPIQTNFSAFNSDPYIDNYIHHEI